MYEVEEGERGLLATLDNLCWQSERAIEDSHAFLLLTDRKAGPKYVPVR